MVCSILEKFIVNSCSHDVTQFSRVVEIGCFILKIMGTCVMCLSLRVYAPQPGKFYEGAGEYFELKLCCAVQCRPTCGSIY